MAVRFRVSGQTREETARRWASLGARLRSAWVRRTGTPAEVRRLGFGSEGDWRRGTVRRMPGESWSRLDPDAAARTVELAGSARVPGSEAGHTVVFGASGSGKTTFLATRAARAIEEGRPVVVVDLHGDLGPAVLERVPPGRRGAIVAIDAEERPVAGIAILAAPPDEVDRAAAHFVAAVKRLSPDGTELAWGFRLERIFDTFTRVVLESGGSLVDLYALLTDPDRRDAARLITRRPATARFLEELGPIVRRDPEFLWSAASRLSKVVLVPALREMLAPTESGLSPEELLREGRALILRVPMTALGPEAAGFAGTVLLARLYLGWAARPRDGPKSGAVLVVLDEAQALAPRLVGEMLSESRKFGFEVVLATQFPERLAPEVRAAAAGAVGSVVAFRVPPATAGSLGPWVGMRPDVAAGVLPSLPVGGGLAFDPELDETRTLAPSPTRTSSGPGWVEAIRRTRTEFDVRTVEEEWGADGDATERLLLAILAAQEEGRRLVLGEILPSAASLPGPDLPLDRLELAWNRLGEGQEWTRRDGGLVLTEAGERRLGLSRPTGATRETGEHRALLLRAFRLFARRGYRLEIVRQGRFDTTLPDAVFYQLGASERAHRPWELAVSLDRVRGGWAWRYFHGRNVHLEAEVSGALRSERVLRGWAKARSREACVLFLVPDAGRARRVRATLVRHGVARDRAMVWTLYSRTTDRGRDEAVTARG